jgi:hypothetical protein
MTKKAKTVIKGKDRLESKARATGSRRLLRLRSILGGAGEVDSGEGRSGEVDSGGRPARSMLNIVVCKA